MPVSKYSPQYISYRVIFIEKSEGHFNKKRIGVPSQY